MEKTYDAILVFGRGIYKDGSIPESAKATIHKAVELYKADAAKHVIFCGKWFYSLDYTPPTTEAAAMAAFATAHGLPAKAALLEEQSFSTVSNCYFVKMNWLMPHHWKKVLLVSLHPMDKRAHYNLVRVLGPEYVCDVVSADFEFPAETMPDKIASEAQKMKNAEEFYRTIKPGDHKRIIEKSDQELAELYLQKHDTTHPTGKEVEAFLASLPAKRQREMRLTRDLILSNLADGYEERVGHTMLVYQIPLSRYPKTYNKQPLTYAALASQKNYISLHLMSVYGTAKEQWIKEAFKKAGKKLDMGKACIRFQELSDVPETVIAEAVAMATPEQYIALYESWHH